MRREVKKRVVKKKEDFSWFWFDLIRYIFTAYPTITYKNNSIEKTNIIIHIINITGEDITYIQPRFCKNTVSSLKVSSAMFNVTLPV